MSIVKINLYWIKRNIKIRFLLLCSIVFSVMISCQPEQHGLHQFNENILTIGEYIKTNQEKYSKFSMLLDEGDLLITLGGYNPHSDGYTLFLPTDEAFNQFVQQNENYTNFEEMLQDTNFTHQLARYHTINKSVHTDNFPNGALPDETLSEDRLTIGIYTEDDNPLYKVNNRAPIIQSNLKMTNGYIHVISGVLQQEEITGYDWLQQQNDYSILAQAMELSGMEQRLWMDKYTILAEHDSIYHRNGIMNVEDLIDLIATPGIPVSNRSNPFYRFAGYHILGGEYYLNDFYLGKNNYSTLGFTQLMIQVGLDIHINPGIDTYSIIISESGDTTVIDYISPLWESSNIITRTGPVHSLSEVLYFKPLP